MKKIRDLIAPLIFILISGLYLSGCQAIAPATSTDATASEESSADAGPRYSPDRVDVRGTITQREYNQGQMLILVEGVTDPRYSRFSRAVVLVTPVTQIVGLDGRTISLSELQNGQQVAILFRGRFRESVSGFSAQAVARKIWLEPLGGY
ncbi:hypothetical protein [Rufibacter tibetensis]|uniref:Uncharacterized protein n=1 Tax=Rufibacter tibetensis TaxID=512763 RepID=A0A0P0CRH6_9BACT|nr:hypothetical protein [Rufibacter tibetensis]ALI99059.1 hypothetical protein DC20_08810 [Rufibacter tibetensis]